MVKYSTFNQDLKQMKKTLITLLTVLPLSIYAATNGVKGGDSTGSTIVNANINKLIKIDKVNDIDLGSFIPGSNPGKASMDFCVGMNKKPANRKYTIKPDGNHNNNGSFRLTLNGNTPNSSNQAINYQLNLIDSTNTKAKDLTPQTIADNNGNGFKTSSSLGCSAQNQKLEVKITSDTTSNIGGDYQDTITLLVSPL
jgi:spore coat protein U-like protein